MRIAEFLDTTASPEGSLVRSWRDEPGVPAFADDLAAVSIGFATLFQTTGNERWFTASQRLIASLRSNFADPDGGFFANSVNAESLITRPKITQDNPTPSDNSLAMEALSIHAALTGDQSAIAELEATMESLSVVARSHPSFAGHALAVWATHLTGIKELAITGSVEATRELERLVWDTYRPDVVVAVNRGSDSTIPLLADRDAGDGATAYVCRNLTCSLPVHTPKELTSMLAG